MTQINNQHMGRALIFSGPHGAGKDTLEGHFRQTHPATERIVRHITRPAVPDERDGQDYYFTDSSLFTAMAERDAFIEHAAYPDCMAGTSRSEVMDKLSRTEFASMAANFEEGIAIHRVLRATGLASVCFFISPVSRETMQYEPETYTEALRVRMERRGRPDDRIANKLVKAILYRELYLQNESQVTYIHNGEDDTQKAILDIHEAAIAPELGL